MNAHKSARPDRRFLLLLPLLSLFALASLACGGSDPTSTPVPATATSGAVTSTATPGAAATATPPPDGIRGGELIRGVNAVHRFWDYPTDPIWFAPQNLQRIYSNLVRFDTADGITVVEDLATDWQVSGDARTFTFTLREGVKWHDGEPFTADDVLYTLNRAKDPPEGLTFPRLSAFRLLENLTASGNTVSVTLANADVDFLLNFAGAWGIILPEHIGTLEGGFNGPERLIGTGPFVLSDQQLQSHITTTRNENFYLIAPDGSPFPYLDSVTTIALPDPEARIAAQQTGRVDISSYDPAEFQSAVGAQRSIGEARVELQVSKLAGVNYLNFNASKPPFDKLEARRALYLLFDRLRMQDLSRLPSGEYATVPTGFLGTIDPFLNEVPSLPEVARETRAAAVAEGKALAQSVGLTRFELLVQSTPPFFQEIAQLVAQIYEDAGIQVTLRVLDATGRSAAIAAGDYQVSLDTPNVVLPSVTAFFREQYLPGGREPWVAAPPERFNTLFSQILATPDGSAREQLLREALQIASDEWVPVVPFDKQVGSTELVAPHVHGRTPVTGQWFNIHWWHDVWIDNNSPRK